MEKGAGTITGVATDTIEGAAQAMAESAAGAATAATAPVIEGAGVVGEAAGAMAPQGPEASALLSSADRAANADLIEGVGPQEEGAIDRLAGSPLIPDPAPAVSPAMPPAPGEAPASAIVAPPEPVLATSPTDAGVADGTALEPATSASPGGPPAPDGIPPATEPGSTVEPGVDVPAPIADSTEPVAGIDATAAPDATDATPVLPTTPDASAPEPTDPATPTAETTTPTDTEPAAAEQTDTAGLKPGDRSYDAIIAEGDAKRAFEAAKADPATSPEDLARLEKEYTGATRERQEAVTDRDSATIGARTEQIKREVTDSVRQEFQGQIDKLSLSNVELRQAMQDMGRQVIEAIGKNNVEAFSEFKKYVDEQDPKKKEALWVKILVILATVGKEFLKGSDIGGTIQQGTTAQRR